MSVAHYSMHSTLCILNQGREARGAYIKGDKKMEQSLVNKEQIISDVIQLDKPRQQYLYCVYDKLADEAGPVFCAVNHHIAARKTKQLLSNVETPEDYILYCVGIFDPSIPAIMDVINERIPFEVNKHEQK